MRETARKESEASCGAFSLNVPINDSVLFIFLTNFRFAVKRARDGHQFGNNAVFVKENAVHWILVPIMTRKMRSENASS